MIYVYEASFERQLTLLESIAAKDTIAVLWLYEGARRSTISGLLVAPKGGAFQAVTTYGECGAKGRATFPHQFNHEFQSRLRSNKHKIIKNCDSLALYAQHSLEWFACAIPHEKMCLVKDVGQLQSIQKHGFSASTNAPSWW